MRENTTEVPTGPTLKFRLIRINEATLGSLNVKPLRVPDDLNLANRSQLIQEYVAGPLPLRMGLVLEVHDPSLVASTLSKLDYEVFVDDKLLGKAQATPNVALPANDGTVQFPLTFSLDTRPMLGDAALPILRNFAVGLADRRRRPMRVGLRVRPTTLAADGGGAASVTRNSLLVEMDSVAVL